MLAASSVRFSSLIRVGLAVSFLVTLTGAATAQGAGAPPAATCPVGKLPPTDPVEAQRVKRLLALSRVWGTVKTLHPSLAYKTVDWDAALVTAIPKVSGARDTQAFADAVRQMLATLRDPVTKVIEKNGARTPRPASADPPPASGLTPDGVLVLRLGHDGGADDQMGWADVFKRATELAERHADAKAVVLDLRNRSGEYPLGFDSAVADIPLVRGSVDAAIAAPGVRVRLHMGFPRQGDSGTDFYRSTLLTFDGKGFAAAPGAKWRPIVFVINSGAAVTDIATALQEAGKAAIVSEGEVGDIVADPVSMDLEGPFVAQVRTSELVWPDGTGGFVPNVVVPASASGGADATLKAALALARQFKVDKAARPRLPGHGGLPPDARYTDMASPSLEYRLLAAFRMHTVVQKFFPYRDLMGEDWDLVLGEFIPRFEAAADGASYALCVAEMWTRIHDSHGFIDSAELRHYFGLALPPLRVRWIEGAMVIDQVLDPSAVQATGLQVGDVVLSVDGEETGPRMARLGRYIAASTLQAHRRNIAGNFLRGARGTAAKLRIRAADGKEREVEIARSVAGDSPLAWTSRRGGDVLRWLPGNIGYADLDRLEVAQVDELFTKFAGARAIVFDGRGYPKGTVWHIAPRLTDRPRVPAALFRQPRVWVSSGHFGRDALGDMTEILQLLPPARPDRPIFRSPTVLLIDERTQSQAEHTGLFLKAANGTLWIGSATAGANGDITTLVVPGGITLTFTGQAVLHPDGRRLQRVGLIPDIEVHPTIAGVRSGRDEALEAALAAIEKRLSER